jgi:hypothetical protein
MGPTTTSRLAAGALTAVVLLTVTALGGAAPDYLSVLVGAVALSGLLVSVRLWCRRCFGSRVSATLLAATVLVGQVLGASVGGPAGEGSQWHPSAVGVVVLCAAVLAVLAVDSRAVRVPDTDRRPYAL